MKKSKSKEIYEEHKRHYLDRPFWRPLNELEKFLFVFRASTDEEKEASKEDAKKYFDEHGELIEIKECDINNVEF